MTQSAEYPKRGVITSVLTTVGWIIVHLLSFPIVAIIVFTGVLFAIWLWQYTTSTQEDKDPPSYAEASGSNDAPAAADGTATAETATSSKAESSSDNAANIAGSFAVVSMIAHGITLVCISDHNYDQVGKLLPNGWTVWQRIGASIFAQSILVASLLAMVALLRGIGWVVGRIKRAKAGKGAETAYHKLHDLEPTQEPAHKDIGVAV